MDPLKNEFIQRLLEELYIVELFSKFTTKILPFGYPFQSLLQPMIKEFNNIEEGFKLIDENLCFLKNVYFLENYNEYKNHYYDLMK